MSGGTLFTPGRFALALGVLLFAAFPHVLLGGQTFVYRDFGLFGYPFAFHHRESFWNGELPFWNPLSACGIPFLAQWNTLTLYPPSLIYLLLPLPWSLNLFCLLHLFLGGMGMYFLTSRWTQNPLAGAVAGTAFAFGGVTLSSLMWPAYSAALGWMPWVVLCGVNAWRYGGRNLPIAALVGAMQMLTGSPEIILLTWMFLGGLWLVELVRTRGDGRKLAWRFPLLVALVTALSAVQLLPFLELLAHSQRDAAYSSEKWAMPAWGWANLLVPLFRYHESSYGVFLQNEQGMMTSYYPGIVIVALVALGLFRLRDARFWIAAGAALIALVLSLGENSWLYSGLKQLFPQIGFMRFPVKYVMLPAFLLPLMAGFMVAALQRSSRDEAAAAWRVGAMVWLAVVSLLALIVCVSWGYPVSGEEWKVTLWNAASRLAFLTAIFAGLCFLGRAQKPSSIWTLQLAVVALLAADGLTQQRVMNPTTTPAVYSEDFLQLDPRPRAGGSRAYIAMSAHREVSVLAPELDRAYAGYRLGGLDNSALLDRIPTVGGFYALDLRDQRNLMLNLFLQPGRSDDGLLDFLGVSQLSTNKFEWVSRPSALPMITAGQRPVFLDGTNTLRELRRAGYQPREVVYLPLEARRLVAAANRADARVTRSEFSAHRLEIEVEASAPAMVTIAQSHYHRWQAFVNGRSVPLWRANYAFQAVEVPAGRSRVLLVFRDDAFRLGAWISFVAILACAALWWRVKSSAGVERESTMLQP